MFKDRKNAGQLLAAKLSAYKNDAGVVLAVPRGGVPIAYYVARELGFPLDIVLIKKIGHPNQREYAIGAASLTDHVVTPHPGVSQSYIEQELVRIRKRLAEMQKKFQGHSEPVELAGKTVIVVDDGAATGHTLLRTLGLIKKSKPAKTIVAIPVASSDAVQLDELVIGKLVDFSARLNARLTVGHVSRPVLIPDFLEESRNSTFSEKIKNLYPAIRYTNPRASNIRDGLEKISAEKQVDVIALRYHKQPFWYHLFHKNPLKELIEQGNRPLLIFPENSVRHG